MRWCGRLAACGCVLGGWIACAQNIPTQQSIQTRLGGPFLLLRGQFDGDRLQYDARGNLRTLAGEMPLSLSALRVVSVRVDDEKVIIVGRREGLEFAPPADGGDRMQVTAKPWDPNSKVEITVKMDGRHPDRIYAALETIFAAGLNDRVVQVAPDYWQPWLRHYLHPQVEADGLQAVAEQNATSCESEGVTPPRMLQPAVPAFSDAARMARYEGTVVVHVTVDTTGRPEQIFIWRPLGMGLDAAAVEAVRRDVFTPAIENGQPVACGMNLTVRFEAGATQ